MDKAKKRRIKKYISWMCMVLVVAILTAMPLLARREEAADGPVASILSGTVAQGTVAEEIHGGGVLAEEDSVELTVPSGVMLTEYLVSNGDFVTEGTPVAKVDRVTVMSAITQVQDSLNTIAEELTDTMDNDTAQEITAAAGGRVKLVYAQAGDSVQQVMLEHGALAVLSLDGLMAVDISAQGLQVGRAVNVAIGGGEAVTGRVAALLEGRATVTVTDEGYAVGEAAVVTDADGAELGRGQLYIHNEWRAVAYAGTVDDVKYDPEETVRAGRVLITLDNVGSSAKAQALSAQHKEYEKLMLTLFELYQSCEITAACDGVVSGIDEDSPLLLSSWGRGLTVSLLANAPNGDDESQYINYVGMVTGIEGGTWALAMNPAQLTVNDYKELGSVPLDTGAMTSVAAFVPSVPVYELSGGQWVQIDASGVAVGDTMLFAADSSGSFVWVVRVAKGSGAGGQPPAEDGGDGSGGSGTTPPSDTDTPVDPDVPVDPPGDTPSDPTTPDDPSVNIPSIPQIPSGGGGYFGGYFGDYSGYTGGMTGEDELELYSLEESVLAVITPQHKMTVTVAVDERDISRIYPGQKAEITLTAIKNETFSASVTQIMSEGTGSGGRSKFQVELTLDRSDLMLSGMSAAVTIPMEHTDTGAVIPVAALAELGADTVVYTGYDEENDMLINPVTVTLGLSDGQNARILSGLKEGDRYYYSYYDTLELSTAVESSGFSFGR